MQHQNASTDTPFAPNAKKGLTNDCQLVMLMLHRMRQGGVEMINVRRLRGGTVEKGVTVKEVAEELGIDRATLYRKLKHTCGNRITVREVQRLAQILDHSNEGVMSIFFEGVVA